MEKWGRVTPFISDRPKREEPSKNGSTAILTHVDLYICVQSYNYNTNGTLP